MKYASARSLVPPQQNSPNTFSLPPGKIGFVFAHSWVFATSMSSGHCDGSTPMGTSLNVVSPEMTGVVFLKTSVKLCSTDGARHERRHFTMYIELKRLRTAATMPGAFACPCLLFLMI